MSLELRIGDLFAQPDADALGHGVNCHGVMGAGIAKVFKAKWRDMYRIYRHACLSGELKLGDVYPYLTPQGVSLGKRPHYIYNIASQDRPGPHADLEALSRAMTETLAHAAEHKVRTLAIPRIGAGIGGLRWDDVAAELDRVASTSAVKLVVVSLPDA